jgi:hypothetical protein
MTVPAPTSPQPTATAQWNGQQWVDYNHQTQQWYVVAIAAPPAAVTGAPAPGQAPRATGSFKEFFSQRSGGMGPYWKFNKQRDGITPIPTGTTYWGIVARDLTEADVVEQTDDKGHPVTPLNGNKRYQLEVPFKVIPDAEFRDGLARMGFKSDSRDKLCAAMSYAGAPEHESGGFIPEKGAFIQVTKVMERPIPGRNPQIIYEVIYRRPDDSWTIQKTAEVEAAHAQLAENPVAAGPPTPVFNTTTKQWEIPQQAAVAPPAAPASVPPPTAPTVPAQQVPAPTAVTAPTVPAPSTAATTPPPPQTAPGAVTAPANGQQTVTTGPQQVPPPSTPAPVQAPPAAPAADNGAASSTPGIMLSQWENMAPEARGALETLTKQQCPAVGSQGQPLEVIGGLPR